MTNTEKILAEFDKRSKKIGDLIIGCYECGETINRESVRAFLSTSIQQTIAEERERERGLVNLYGTPNCDYLHHNKKQQHESGEICPVVTEITDLIASFKDINKKE